MICALGRDFSLGRYSERRDWQALSDSVCVEMFGIEIKSYVVDFDLLVDNHFYVVQFGKVWIRYSPQLLDTVMYMDVLKILCCAL